MNCPDCHDLLHQRLDGQCLPGSADLDEHLARCTDCRERFAAAQRLAGGLRLLPRPAPSPDLSRRIARQAQAERRARLFWRRRLVAGGALAAGLLLAVFAFNQVPRWFPARDEEDRRAERDQRAPKKPAPRSPNPQPGPSLEQTLEEARAVALAVTHRTATETLASARKWLPPANSLSVPLPLLEGGSTLAPVLDPPAESLRQAGANVSAGLQPVTSSARRALNLFLREIPPLGSDALSGS
jgi:predicted anti-sigma-YlaC factor YlaD